MSILLHLRALFSSPYLFRTSWATDIQAKTLYTYTTKAERVITDNYNKISPHIAAGRPQ